MVPAATLTAQALNICFGTPESTQGSAAYRWATAPQCALNWVTDAMRTTTLAAGVEFGEQA